MQHQGPFQSIDAGEYFLRGVPFAGGGGGGGGGVGVPVPLFAVRATTVQLSVNTMDNANSVVTAPGSGQQLWFPVCGGTTSPQTAANSLAMWHGFDKTNGALVLDAQKPLSFTAGAEGQYLFVYNFAGRGANIVSGFQSGSYIMLAYLNDTYVVASDCRDMVGMNATYSERGCLVFQQYMLPGDKITFHLGLANSTFGLVIDNITVSGVILNHPPV